MFRTLSHAAACKTNIVSLETFPQVSGQCKIDVCPSFALFRRRSFHARICAFCIDGFVLLLLLGRCVAMTKNKDPASRMRSVDSATACWWRRRVRSIIISVPASSGSAEVATNPVCDRNITSSLIVKVTIAVVKQYKACLQSSALSILRRRALSR